MVSDRVDLAHDIEEERVGVVVERLVVEEQLREQTQVLSVRLRSEKTDDDVPGGGVLLTVGRSYVGNDVARSTLSGRACACSYENFPKINIVPTALVIRPPGAGFTNRRSSGTPTYRLKLD